MQWFKHHSNFRNSPAFKFIANNMGDRGVAAVYRLYEVFTERFGVDNNFTGSLLLSPPYSEHWLANEILTGEEELNDYENPTGNLLPVTTQALRHFLGMCESAGIVTLKRQECGVVEVSEDGESKPTGKKQVWLTVTIPGFASLADEYTARKRTSKALETMKS
jgi:hypothetical protein